MQFPNIPLTLPAPLQTEHLWQSRQRSSYPMVRTPLVRKRVAHLTTPIKAPRATLSGDEQDIAQVW
jgi:hypothetical protein